MSNKPVKKSDQKKANEKMSRKQRDVGTIPMLPSYMYIVSEGTETEPNYISGFAKKINKKCKDYGLGKRIVVRGTGRNTRGLLDFARDEVEKEFPMAQEVWLMYDKDDFPYDDFDNTQKSAEEKTDKRRYRVAWSNECIELWFLLHFQELHSNIGRDAYKAKLNEHFREAGYPKYEKNMKNIFAVLEDKTDTAIKRAKRQYEEYRKDDPPSKRCPATRVYELVQELKKYL